jgi:hypothetical protein
MRSSPNAITGGSASRAALEELEGMKDRRRAHLEVDVSYALLRHVERLPGLEDPLVEGRETVDVLRQERHVVDTLDKRHPRSFSRFRGRASTLDQQVAALEGGRAGGIVLHPLREQLRGPPSS